jgi:hypothetical protein
MKLSQGHTAVGKIRSIEKSYDLIGNRTRDIAACSIINEAPLEEMIASPFMASTPDGDE